MAVHCRTTILYSPPVPLLIVEQCFKRMRRQNQTLSYISRGVIGEGAQKACALSFLKLKRISGKGRESQAIADCFFSCVTIFLTNQEKIIEF